jgi:hypothetical protein
MSVKKVQIMFFFFLVNVVFVAQSKSNLEVFNELVDSSAVSLSLKILNSNSVYSLSNNTVKEYSTLDTRVENSLIRNGIKITHNKSESKVSYSILQATVLYSDIFKDGLFGDYLIERKFLLSGEYQIENSSSVLSSDTFYYTVTDTIPYDHIAFIENGSLPFTKGTLPAEPFFPSILEPVVAITAVVVTVVLFFSVRSK